MVRVGGGKKAKFFAAFVSLCDSGFELRTNTSNEVSCTVYYQFDVGRWDDNTNDPANKHQIRNSTPKQIKHRQTYVPGETVNCFIHLGLSLLDFLAVL